MPHPQSSIHRKEEAVPALYVHESCDALEILAGLMTRRTDVVLIDGPSGSGKTSLALGLQQAARARGIHASLVHLDQIYQGWDGLADAAHAVATRLVLPFAAGKQGRWDEYDWERERVLRSHDVTPFAPLIVEGSGALHPDAAAVAKARVWVTADRTTRRERALARDGEAYALQWQRWERLENAFAEQHATARRADLVVDTAPRPRIAA